MLYQPIVSPNVAGLGFTVTARHYSPRSRVGGRVCVLVQMYGGRTPPISNQVRQPLDPSFKLCVAQFFRLSLQFFVELRMRDLDQSLRALTDGLSI